jgi:hypothetical protein
MSSSPPSSSSPHANNNIYPASFIKKHLVPNADSYRKTLSSLRAMDKVWQRTCVCVHSLLLPTGDDDDASPSSS